MLIAQHPVHPSLLTQPGAYPPTPVTQNEPNPISDHLAASLRLRVEVFAALLP